MNPRKFHVHEIVTTDASAGTETKIPIKGRKTAHRGALRWQAVSIDEGLIANGSRTVKDLELRIVPKRYPNAVNYGDWLPFAAEPGAEDARNVIPLGYDFAADEDVDVYVRRGAGAADTVRVKFHIVEVALSDADPEFVK